jgi:threonine 3-dehydrogenase
METMLAVIKETASAGAEWKAIGVPEPGPQQVLVRIRSAALCGTDLHIYEWNQWAQSAGIKIPFIMGHEFCGDVVAVGDGVRGLAEGDKVAGETHYPCGCCKQCLNGEQHICNHLRLFGVHMNGCFAAYTCLPAICARTLPSAIPYDLGAIMEPLGTAFRAAQEVNAGGAYVAVVGCGPIGIFAIACAVAMGAAKVIALDVADNRLDLARRMGAGLTLNPARQPVIEPILDATGGYGVDAIIEASGNSQAVSQAFRFLRKGGRVALIGLPGDPVSLDLGKDIVFKEAKVVGIHGRKMFATWTAMENMLATGKLAVQPAVTHVLPLARWREGIELARTGQACKVVYHPQE